MSLAAHEGFVADFAEQHSKSMPSWLQVLRHDAFAYYQQHGLPTKKSEEWKYTNLLPLTSQRFSIAQPATTVLSLEQLSDYALLADNYRIVIHDGRVDFTRSQLAGLPTGCIITSLANAITQHPDLLQQHLQPATHTLHALNLALMQDGVVIVVPRDVVLDKPVEIVVVATTENTAQHLHHVILLEENSGATIIENYIGAIDVNYFINVITDTVLQAGAQYQHIKLVREGALGIHHAKHGISQHRDSSSQLHAFTLSGKLIRNDTSVDLVGVGANADLTGLYLVDQEQLVDHHTVIKHQVPQCISQENYKGILAGNAKGVFNGRINVAKDAQKTQANLQNNNLLLSTTAEINTKPELEIYADDVKCAHGTTVGQLDAEQIFYLQTRGINQQAAQVMLLQAFVNELISTVKYRELLQKLQLLVTKKLENLREGIR